MSGRRELRALGYFSEGGGRRELGRSLGGKGGEWSAYLGPSSFAAAAAAALAAASAAALAFSAAIFCSFAAASACLRSS